MRKPARTLKWIYTACKTQSDEWLVKNSQRTDGLFKKTEVLIMRLVLRERLENKDGDVQSL